MSMPTHEEFSKVADALSDALDQFHTLVARVDAAEREVMREERRRNRKHSIKAILRPSDEDEGRDPLRYFGMSRERAYVAEFEYADDALACYTAMQSDINKGLEAVNMAGQLLLTEEIRTVKLDINEEKA